MQYYARILDARWCAQLIQLLWFIAIILVFMLAWGVAQYSLLYPQAYQSGWILRDFIHLSFWQMMTQFYLSAALQAPPYDTADETGLSATCAENATVAGDYTVQRCADTSVNWIVVIGLAVRCALCSVFPVPRLILLTACDSHE